MAEEELSTRRRGTLSRLPEGLLPAIERLDRSITGVVSPVGITTIGLVTLYYTALSYGLLVIGIVGGRPGLARVVSSSNTHPMLMIIAIPMIPVALVLLEASEVEDKTLSVWRKKISPVISKMPILGSIINYFWPEMKREPFANQNSGGSIIITIDYLARSIASGLMLPFLGYLFGKTLFGKTKLNTFQRTLLVTNSHSHPYNDPPALIKEGLITISITCVFFSIVDILTITFADVSYTARGIFAC